MRRIASLAVLAWALGAAGTASAGPIVSGGPWYEFIFGDVGSSAIEGTGATPSSGGNSVYADPPPWTFTSPLSGSVFTVTDAFITGDAFEVFDNGVSIGSTPLVPEGTSGSDDPAVTVLDPAFSHASFLLGAGEHSITIVTLASPFGSGAAYFRLDAINAVPEPSTLALASLGGLGVVGRLIRRRKGA